MPNPPDIDRLVQDALQDPYPTAECLYPSDIEYMVVTGHQPPVFLRHLGTCEECRRWWRTATGTEPPVAVAGTP